jgi:hypothetical protein
MVRLISSLELLFDYVSRSIEKCIGEWIHHHGWALIAARPTSVNAMAERTLWTQEGQHLINLRCERRWFFYFILFIIFYFCFCFVISAVIFFFLACLRLVSRYSLSKITHIRTLPDEFIVEREKNPCQDPWNEPADFPQHTKSTKDAH